MSDDIVQTLIETHVVRPVEDVDGWCDRLVDAGLLTDRQAELVVRKYGRDESRQEIAEAMGVSLSRVDNLRRAVNDRLQKAEQTINAVWELRGAVNQPDRCDKCGSALQSFVQEGDRVLCPDCADVDPDQTP